jgi:acyl-CoA synthetase (AMP-forming)/AMP-acid ligase II
LLILVVMRKSEAIYHITANDQVLRRTYQETADRARGLAYFLKKHGYKRVGILCPNTPAFLESIFGIAAAGAANVCKAVILVLPKWVYIC